MIRFKTETQEKCEKMVGEVEGKMLEYKRKYEGEVGKCEEMRERIGRMEEEVAGLEVENDNLQKSAVK
jgi:hypothetical protein